MKIIYLTILIFFPLINIFGDPFNMAFDIQAIVSPSGTSVKLKWELTLYNKNVSIQRKLREDAAWGTAIALAENATEYTDNTVQNGKIYEYHVYASTAHEYISVAINAPLIDYRGKVLLLVEKSLNVPLSFEINRLMMDMRGDGWQVIKIDVDKTSKPSDVKILIKNAFDLDKVNIKAVFLLGQIPLPRSGCIAPDGHGDHYGAWAADTYYADIDGNWTDATANCASNFNANIPGDGKFDQSYMPSAGELQVGRVDMSNLPAFTESYVDLTKRYLNKDHHFRKKLISPPRKALVLDYFSQYNFAWSGYHYFNALLGKANTKRSGILDFYTSANLWTYATSGGESDGFVNQNWHTSDFASKSYNYVFSMLFGSYFGDYQMGNNFMKGALASKGWILTCAWAGNFSSNANWVHHHMASGDNIGYSAFVNQNNNNIYYGSSKGFVTINLLGDPTLRQDMIAPPVNVKSSVVSNYVKITWSPCSDSIEGYHIYKSKGLDSIFTRITSAPVKDTFWTDPAIADAKYYYQVKAYRMEKGRCGSYGNTSRGIFTSNDPLVEEYPIIINKPYVTNPIPDQMGYIKKSFYYKLPLSSAFADNDPDDIDMPIYSVYKADSNALPSGWTFNPLTNAITVSPLPAKPIRFKVVVKAIDMTQNFATDTFEINIVDTSKAILDSEFEREISIYPNPAHDKAFIEYYSNCECNVICSIADMAGKKLYEESFFAMAGINTKEIDVTTMPAGIYIVSINGNKMSYKKKFIVSR